MLSALVVPLPPAPTIPPRKVAAERKTLAFLLPALERAREADEAEQREEGVLGESLVLVLTPTRELAVQTLAAQNARFETQNARFEPVSELFLL